MCNGQHDERLKNIELSLNDIATQLREINGSVKRHTQELYGATGQDGLVGKVTRLSQKVSRALTHADRQEGAKDARQNAMRLMLLAAGALLSASAVSATLLGIMVSLL